MSWGLVGAAVITVGGGIAANYLGGGNKGGGGGSSSGGGSISGLTKAEMDKYIKDTETDADRLITNIKDIANKLQSDVKKLGEGFSKDATDQEKQAIERINKANETLQSQAQSRSATFSQDVQKAIDDLAFGTEALNLGSRADTLTQLNNFKTEIQNVESTALERLGAATSKAETDTAKLAQDFQSGTSSLGDVFLERARQAQEQYTQTMGQATSTAPDLISEFTRAADQLSRGAVQTRMNMLSAADPRALELSAMADENAAAMMSGRIGADVQANLSRSSAMRALQGGFGASSEMGRGLAARDLGLTSLDLQQRGAQLNESQRMLNYNTRVAGLQTDAGALMRDNQQLLAEQGRTLLGSRLQTAESDRNQRFGAMEAGFQTRASNVAATRDQSVGLARDIFSTRANAAQVGLDSNLSNLNDIYNNRYNTVGTMFNTRTALGEQLFKTGIGLSTDMYSSAVNASSDFYGTNLNVSGNIFGTYASATNNAANLNAQAENNRLDVLARMRGASAGTMAGAYQQDMLNAQQATASRNAMWGSLINTGASLAGNIFGNSSGRSGGFGGSGSGMSRSQMISSTTPGTTGTYQSWAGGYVPRATAAR